MRAGGFLFAMLLLNLEPSCEDESCGKLPLTFLSLKQSAGNFSSPNYPGNYPPSISCHYRFVGRKNEGIEIRFKDFHLENKTKIVFTTNSRALGKTQLKCKNDYIEIYTEDSVGVKQLYGKYCGREVLPVITSVHDKMDVMFRSNYDLERRGFLATFTFKNEGSLPTPVTEDALLCGSGSGEQLTGVSGLISSPSYPRHYPSGIHCIWLIRVSPGRRIFVRVIDLQLEGGLECSRAELSLIDGYVNYGKEHLSEEKTKICGDLQYYASHSGERELTKLSNRNRLLVSFHTSPDSVGGKGFQLLWTEVSFQDPCPGFYCEGGEMCIDAEKRLCSRQVRHCIDSSLVCDGYENCGVSDYSDENQCSLSLKIGLSVAACVVVCTFIICTLCCIRKRRHGEEMRSGGGAGGGQRGDDEMKDVSSLQLRQLEHSPTSSHSKKKQMFTYDTNHIQPPACQYHGLSPSSCSSLLHHQYPSPHAMTRSLPRNNHNPSCDHHSSCDHQTSCDHHSSCDHHTLPPRLCDQHRPTYSDHTSPEAQDLCSAAPPPPPPPIRLSPRNGAAVHLTDLGGYRLISSNPPYLSSSCRSIDV